MYYFAFVHKDEDRRYCAQLPDFPGCSVVAERLADVSDALQSAVLQQVVDRDSPLPKPTSAGGLPRVEAELDGYWMLVDLAPVVSRFRLGVAR